MKLQCAVGVVRRTREKQEDRGALFQINLDQGNGKCQSDRSQVIGGGTPDRAVGSLGHLGYLTLYPQGAPARL